jgi:hypothetical protein
LLFALCLLPFAPLPLPKHLSVQAPVDSLDPNVAASVKRLDTLAAGIHPERFLHAKPAVIAGSARISVAARVRR